MKVPGKRPKAGLALALLLACAHGVWAGAADETALRERLAELLPGMPVSTVAPSPLPGVYAVEMEDGSVLYADAEASHVIAGDLYALTEAGPVNLAEIRRNERRRELLAAVDLSDMIVFAPKETKAVVSVFTDVDCGYCRKLHQERAELADYGIEVRYLAYPRAGADSETYETWFRRGAPPTVSRRSRGLKQANACRPGPARIPSRSSIGSAPSLASAAPRRWSPERELIPGYMPAADLAKRLGVL